MLLKNENLFTNLYEFMVNNQISIFIITTKLCLKVQLIYWEFFE